MDIYYLILLMLILFTDCEEKKADTELTGIQVNKLSLTLNVDDRVQLNANPVPENVHTDFIWTAGDDKIATVGINGLVIAIAEGSTDIQVASGNIKVKIPVTVGKKDIPIAGISVSFSQVTLKPGGKATVIATPIPSNANITFVWQVENELIASVSPDGVIEGIADGVTNVVVSNQSGDIKKKIKVTVAGGEPSPPTKVLYNKILTDMVLFPDIISTGVTCQYTVRGLNITGTENTIRLNRYYALGKRLVRYHVRFSDDAKAVFRTNNDGDFEAYVDMSGKQISISTRPETPAKKVDFLSPEHEYEVEIYRTYQEHKIRIKDLSTGQSAELSATHDGQGGVGQGVVNEGLYVGGQHDYYCFGLKSGKSMLVRQISVLAQDSALFLLIYGDSVSEPEGYFPTSDYPKSWTQLIMNNVKGKAVSSGRGGGNINDLTERIKNELPFVKAKYVMITIGTNGGNTEANLSNLVEYIKEQGAIPILNNIPCNESSTQIAINQTIETVRRKYGINGCRFDLATSLSGEGRDVDKTMMYWENYTNGWGEIYHHPNVKGGQKMFERSLADVPEIYE